MKTNDLSKIISSFTVYKFLLGLTTPFIQTEAYRRGIIDGQGKVLKSDDQLSFSDKQAFTDFDRLIISLRRLLLMIPDPYVRANMRNVPSILNLIAEECGSIGGDKQYFVEIAKRELSACRLFEEGEGGAAPASIGNSMGGTFNTTTQTNPRENPQGNLAGYDPVLATGKRIFKRRKPNKFYLEDEKY